MSAKCKFCDFKVIDCSNDEFGDYLEGEHVSMGDAEISLGKLEHGSTTLCVSIESDWNERIPFKIGEESGSVSVPTGFEGSELFDVCFCPMCGRKL